MNVRKNRQKKWTVLIYANGNNELEPEIYNRVRDLQKEVGGKDIHVVIQLARIPQQMLKLLRPQLETTVYREWAGIRRYVLKEGKNILIEELGKVNMADPFTLYHFITWGITHYPAENVMLVLSGHGAGFIGFMTDYTQDKPYIMTVEGFAGALYLSKEKTGRAVDCVLLDACYMNMVELWYELACIPQNTVRYILAPMQNVVLEGLPYPIILKLLESNMAKGIHKILKIVTGTFNESRDTADGLLLVRTKQKHFIILKQAVNREAKQLNKNHKLFLDQLNKRFSKTHKEPLLSLMVLEKLSEDDLYKTGSKKQKISRILKDIIIEPAIEDIPLETSMGPCLYFPLNSHQYESIKDIYKNLHFSFNNEWINIIEGGDATLRQQKVRPNYTSFCRPVVIPTKYVVTTMMLQNTALSQQQALETVKQLGWLR